AHLHAQRALAGNGRGAGWSSRRAAHTRGRWRGWLFPLPTRGRNALQPDLRGPTMIIQIVQFRLVGISDAQYSEHAEQVAPHFRQLPWLVSKVWLANAETNTYVGVYTWKDRAALEQYRASETYAQMMGNPHFVELTDREFAVLAQPTGVTAPALAQAA